MRKLIGGCFTTLGVIFAILLVLAFGCSRSGSKTEKTEVQETATQSQASESEDESKDEKKAESKEEKKAEDKEEQKGEAKQEEQQEEAKKEDPAPTEESSDTTQESSEDSSEGEGSSLPADYIRPEFQEFCDSYLAFYREYADFMARYKENPSDTSLLLGLSDMLSREADMVEAMDSWEAEDLTKAELALYTETSAEMLRISADILENAG